MIRIIARKLTAEAFEPFGEIVDISSLQGAIIAKDAFAATADAKVPIMQIVKVEATSTEFAIDKLESHPFSSQTFLSLDQSPSLIAVCERDENGLPDMRTLQSFIAVASQIVTYKGDVLHHRLTPLKTPATFAMTMCQTGLADDTVVYDLPEAVMIEVPTD